MRKILLDGDVLLYQTAHESVKKLDWGDGRWSYTGDAREALGRFRSYCNELVAKHPGRLVVCLSGESEKNYRKGVDPSYKCKRDTDPFKKPPHFSALKELVATDRAFDVQMEEILEADDIIGLLAEEDDIIVTIDKDLQTIPSWNLDLRNMDRAPIKWHPDQSWAFFMQQILMGDSVDDIPGIRGVGPKTAEKILADIPTGEMWEVVQKEYESRGYTRADALRTARLVRILQPGDYNWKTKEVRLWKA